MKDLTLDRAIELAREVVEEFGKDYVYPESHKRLQWDDEPADSIKNPPSCVYVHEGCPSCLVGQILHRHGVSIDVLSKNEFVGAGGVAWQTARAGMAVRVFLADMQIRQDDGKTWGAALNYALDRLD